MPHTITIFLPALLTLSTPNTTHANINKLHIYIAILLLLFENCMHYKIHRIHIYVPGMGRV